MPLQAIRTDITLLSVDAIVNAANNSLLGGGGVDGAIHRAAGPDLLAECRGIGSCPTGESRITHSYQLPSKWVIHTVGPVWQGGECGEQELLASCYRSSLQLAAQHDLQSIAFPAISTGVYGYPGKLAAVIAVRECHHFQLRNQRPTDIYFVCFDPQALTIYEALLKQK